MRPGRDSNAEEKITDRKMIAVMLSSFFVREFLATIVPLGNDEVYYWDWGRDLRLSYFDHPPGVSWLSAGAQAIFSPVWGGLHARGLVPVVHMLTSVCLFMAYRTICGGRRNRISDVAFLCLTQAIPAFALGGFLLVPDAGLLLAASAGLLLALRLGKRNTGLTVIDGVTMGVVAGLGGLFKYHAAPIFGGLLLGLAINRSSRLTRELPFWFTLVVTGLVVTLPVWIWNARNGMASFAFQASRGISGARFDLPRAMRTLAGEFIFLTPGFFGLLVFTIITLWRHRTRNNERTVLLATVPLLLLIHVTMTYKEVLPHWGLPAFWLLIPDAALIAGQGWPNSKLRINMITAACVSSLIIGIVGIPVIRQKAIDLSGGKPGALGELTFWPDFSASSAWRRIQEQAKAALVQQKPPHCPDRPVLASFRWFTVAHMAWSLPGNPVVRSFEAGSRYYYHDRDRTMDETGCPVLAIGEKAHANQEMIRSRMIVSATGEITDERYVDRPLSWWTGYLK
ncbi:hypothetical protein EBZ80_04845 [bacterium]|nr:hypothetical protein [bacterium]